MQRAVKETFVQNRNDLCIGIASTRIESIKRQHIRKVGVRAYNGKRISIAGGLGFPDEEVLWKNALERLPDGIEYPLLPFSDNVESVRNEEMQLSDSEMLEEVQILLSHFRSRFPHLIWSGNVHSENYFASLKNDSGLDLSFYTPFFKCVLTFKEKKSRAIFDGITGTYGVTYDRESAICDLELGCRNYQSVIEFKKSKKLPVILSFGYENIVLRKILRNLSCVSTCEGSSVFSGKMGETILNPSLSLIQSSDSANTGFKFFDYEGTSNPGNSVTLIRDGAAVRNLSDRIMSLEYGCENSGSAFKGKYDTVPSMGIPYVQLGSAGRTLAEITSGRDAILVCMASAGGSSGDGQISFPVGLSYLLRDGKLIGRLPRVNLSSSIWKMFGDDYLGSPCDSLLKLSHAPAAVCLMDVEPV